MATCYIHEGTPALYTCEGCGEGICDFCRAKNRQEALCYLCVTKLEPLPEEPVARSSGLDEAFPDVSAPGWRGDTAAFWRGGVLGVVAACVLGVPWGLWDSLWDRSSIYEWVFLGIPVGAAVGVGAGLRHGWLPVVLGAVDGVILIAVRTATLMYRYAVTDPEFGRHFRKAPPWDQAAAVLMAALGNFGDAQALLFAGICIAVTAATATGLRLRST